ncbi:hypothetical protein [Aeromonas sp.]|uniref:hypothetical protein n=1 Tax=Aeromonas sp. TaxID=647 RepID=UPI002590B326|nr:hypothetical protein [Aeromonas sp.]MCX7127043.1 hypothetical protein [Aeromonas sp.]
MSSKVLVISHNAFSDVYNNGKTMESILSSFDSSNLAQLFFSQNEAPDFTYCRNYYKITDIDVLKSMLMCKGTSSAIGSKLECPPITNVNHNIKGFSKKNIDGIMFSFFKTLFHRSKIFRDLLWSCSNWHSSSLERWIANFNPDVIFYVGGDSKFSHEIAMTLSDKLNIPLISYFTDDYILSKEFSGLDIISRYSSGLLESTYKRTIKKSSKLYTIGKSMSEHYANHFNREFGCIMNSVDWKPFSPKMSFGKDINVSYFGGLHLGRSDMIIKFAKKHPFLKVKVYSITPPSSSCLLEFKLNNIEYCGGVTGKELDEAMFDADAFLHIESDDESYCSLTKLSVSTKIPEYLISSRLVIGYGPVYLASMKILKDNNIGIVISSAEDKDDVKLNEFLSNGSAVSNMVSLGYNFANENFLKSKNSTMLKFQIENVVANHGKGD